MWPTLDPLDTWSCGAALGSWAGMKTPDKPCQLLSHSCSKSDSALPAPSWKTPVLSGPMGFSWHWEAWDSGLRDKSPNSPLHQLSLLLPRPPRALGTDLLSPCPALHSRGPGPVPGSKVLLSQGQAAAACPCVCLCHMDTCQGRAGFALTQVPRHLCQVRN